MKFTLVITICSQMYGTCMTPLEPGYLYDSHFDCATVGYLHSFDALQKLGADVVNNNKIVVTFNCKANLVS